MTRDTRRYVGMHRSGMHINILIYNMWIIGRSISRCTPTDRHEQRALKKCIRYNMYMLYCIHIN